MTNTTPDLFDSIPGPATLLGEWIDDAGREHALIERSGARRVEYIRDLDGIILVVGDDDIERRAFLDAE
jgi:hypothetical protein